MFAVAGNIIRRVYAELIIEEEKKQNGMERNTLCSRHVCVLFFFLFHVPGGIESLEASQQSVRQISPQLCLTFTVITAINLF